MNHRKLVREGIRRAQENGLDWGLRAQKIAKKNKRQADEFALSLAPYMEHLNDRGFRTIMEKTHKMNRDGVATPTGKAWHISTVHRLIKRIERMEQELEQKRAA
jgi:hypothetical protein